MSFSGSKSPVFKTKYINESTRWLVLFLCVAVMIGSNYIYDNPSALHDELRDGFRATTSERQPRRIFELEFNLLYTVYSLPNIFIPIIGGNLVDSSGAAYMLLIFSGITLFGQIVVSLGVSTLSMPTMLLGRIIFGVGGESLCVATSSILRDWFTGKEYALAMAILVSISRVGGVANNILSPRLAKEYGVSFPFWLGSIVSGLSMISSIFILHVDSWRIGSASNRKEAKALRLNSPTNPNKFRKIRCTPISLHGFGYTFWVLVFSCLVVTGCVLPFNNIASPFLIHKYFCQTECCAPNEPQCQKQLSAQLSVSILISIPYTVSGFLAPAIGAFVDYIGMKAILIIISPLLLCVAHILFVTTEIRPGIPLVLIGIGYAIYTSSLWPAIPDVVPDSRKGSAFGVVTAVQNIGLAVFPACIAILHSYRNSYEPAIHFFASLAFIGIILGILLNYDDFSKGDRLNGPKFRQILEFCCCGASPPCTRRKQIQKCRDNRNGFEYNRIDDITIDYDTLETDEEDPEVFLMNQDLETTAFI